MYDCNEINYIGRSDKQLEAVLSLVSLNEYQEIKVNGYLVKGEEIHFFTQNKGVDELEKLKCCILPTLTAPIQLIYMIRNFVDETETHDGNYGGDGSLEKGFKVFQTKEEDFKYHWAYKFSIKPVLVYYGK